MAHGSVDRWDCAFFVASGAKSGTKKFAGASLFAPLQGSIRIGTTGERLGDASVQAVGKAPQVIGEGHEKDEDIYRGDSY
jgi:hypothetical protein